MAFVGPKVTDWSEDAYNAGVKGFNLLRDFEREMWRVYPETQSYNFGYFADFDMNEVMSMGWEHLETTMWDVEDWNKTVGTRFALQTDGGTKVMYGENYIMMMPRKFRDEVILPARKEAIDRIEQSADAASTYVHPDDPEKNKMQDAAAKLSEATSSTEKVVVKGKGGPDLGTDPGGDVW